MPSGPVATSGALVRARTYRNAQIGIRLSAASAHHGIFARDLAAAMYGGSGFGGGGAGGAAGAWRAGGPLGAAGAAAPVVAGVAAAAGFSSPAGFSPASSPPPSPSAARRSRERRSRCSGTSVIRRPR